MIRRCEECGASFDATKKLCPECGCPVNNENRSDGVEKLSRSCNKCNNVLAPGDKFCKNCGSPCVEPTKIVVNTPSIQHTQPKTKAPTVDVNQRYEEPNDNYYDEKNGFWQKQNNIIYVCLAAVSLIAISLALYFGVFAKQDSNSSLSATPPTIAEEANTQSSAPAESTMKYIIAEKMWFRTTPHISTSNRIDLLNYGASFDVISYEGNWAYIEFNGRYGYVNSDYIVGENDFIRFNSLITKSNRGDLMATARQALVSYSKKESRIGGYDTRAAERFANEKNGLQCFGYKETKFDTGETVVLLKMLRTDTSKRWIAAFRVSPSGSFEFINDFDWVNNPTVYKSDNNYYIL